MPTKAPVAVIATCKSCDTITRIPDIETLRRDDEKFNELWSGFHRIPCRGCGRSVWADVVRGKRGKRECGAWCTEGVGRSCTCQCEGRNHGATYQHTGALWYAR